MAKTKVIRKPVTKRGRPKLKPENVRSKYVAIPLTAKEYRQLRAEAKIEGIRITIYLRSKLLA